MSRDVVIDEMTSWYAHEPIPPGISTNDLENIEDDDQLRPIPKVLRTRTSMRKIKQHFVMIKNLCMRISKIDREREREREREAQRIDIFQKATVTK